MSINAGELNSRVTIRLRRDHPSMTMGLESTYHDEIARWAKIAPVGTGIYIESVQADARVTHRVTLRHIDGITTDHEIVHKNVIYAVRRSAPLNGEPVFTIIEVEELRHE